MFWLLDKTVRKFAELSIYCQRQNVAQKVYFLVVKFYAVIHWGSPKRERQTDKLCLHLLRLSFTEVCKISTGNVQIITKSLLLDSRMHHCLVIYKSVIRY